MAEEIPYVAEEDPAGSFNSICAYGVTPNIMSGAFVSLIQQQFANPDHIAHPDLKGTIWTPDDTTTEIMIEDAGRWNSAILQKRAAIIIKRGKWTFKQVGLSDAMLDSVDRVGYTDFKGVKDITGSHTFLIIGSTSLDSDLIAEEVAFYLMHYTPYIMKNFNLDKFQVHDLTEQAHLKESKDHFITAVTVSYHILYSWSVQRQTPIFRAVGLTTNIVGDGAV